MKNTRQILFIVLLLVAGAAVTATYDWKQERRALDSEATSSAEQLVGLISLYPLHEADATRRSLLAKTLVEQSGSGIAFLLVQDREGKVLMSLGDPALRFNAKGGTTPSAAPRRRYRAPTGKGDIIEISKAFAQGDSRGTIHLGLRLLPPPRFSAKRVSAVASVVFLMMAAMIVGYYVILLSIRHWSRRAAAQPGQSDAAAAPRTDNVLTAIEHINDELGSIRRDLKVSQEQNTELSSRLGVAAFEAQQAYRVLDGLESGILIVDQHDRIRCANDEALRLLGAARSDIEGKTYSEALQYEDLLILLDARDGNGSSQTMRVETHFDRTAPERIFEVTYHSLPDATGESVGTILSIADVTRIRQARKTQEEFIATTAHELLTPLTSIKTYAEMLMTGDVRGESTEHEFYNTINSETDRLTSLIRNLLNVSKLEVGSLDIERTPVKTDWLLEQSLPAIEAAAQKKDITIEKQLPENYPAVLGDKELLKVILVNILGNAVKYTPANGLIHLLVEERDRHVAFAVSDTGCGIPPEEQPHIFDKFYRGKSTLVRDQSGSGLGLATAMEIARLHRGTIDVESILGQGTTFTVSLPIEEYQIA